MMDDGPPGWMAESWDAFATSPAHNIDASDMLAADPTGESIRHAIAGARKAEPSYLWPSLDLGSCGTQRAPEREWLLDQWMPLRKATLLTGEGAVGKSLLAQLLSTCVAIGRPFLGLAVGQMKAAYISWEDDLDELWRRQEAICAGLGVSMTSMAGHLELVSMTEAPEPFLFAGGGDDGPAATRFGHNLIEKVRDIGIGFLALDNMSQIAAIDHNAIEEVAPLAHWLNGLAQSLDGAVLALHHPNKAGEDWLDSVAYTNQFRSRLLMKRPEDHPFGQDARVLTNPKANYSRRGGEIELLWCNGTFKLEAELPSDRRSEMAAIGIANAENDAFMKCLTAASDARRAVSHNPGSNYALRCSLPCRRGGSSIRRPSRAPWSD